VRHSFTPTVVKNQNDEVSHRPIRAAKTVPPTSGRTQPATPRMGSTSIFTVNAPKKTQPRIEWVNVRGLNVSKPSAYRQCTATGTASRNAIRPDQRCRV